MPSLLHLEAGIDMNISDGRGMYDQANHVVLESWISIHRYDYIVIFRFDLDDECHRQRNTC